MVQRYYIFGNILATSLRSDVFLRYFMKEQNHKFY
nr:MAG TPA: hypothetical protein [Caudoviricetes sp.]